MIHQVKHVSFNPTTYGAMGYPSALGGICSDQEKEGWSLLRIVYHNTYEAVAVFERGE